MIQIETRKEDGLILEMQISGHAGFAEKGEDLVCAAISSISTGLLNALDTLCPEECELYLEDTGMIRILVKKASHDNQLILNTGMIQCMTVADSYPDHIQLKEV